MLSTKHSCNEFRKNSVQIICKLALPHTTHYKLLPCLHQTTNTSCWMINDWINNFKAVERIKSLLSNLLMFQNYLQDQNRQLLKAEFRNSRTSEISSINNLSVSTGTLTFSGVENFNTDYAEINGVCKFSAQQNVDVSAVYFIQHCSVFEPQGSSTAEIRDSSSTSSCF